MSAPSHLTHLEMGQEIRLQFYQQEEPVTVRFVDANNLVDTQNAVQWILGGMSKHAVVGVDLEWIAENQSWQLHPTYSPISLIQLASHNRCALLSTQGHLHHTSAAFLRDFINSPAICKAGVGNQVDKEKMFHDLGTELEPPNWFDVQRNHAVQDLTEPSRLLGFNYLVEVFLVNRAGKELVYPVDCNYETKQLTTFSDWNTPTLSMAQVIYAAFDAIGAKDLYLYLSETCLLKNCAFCYHRSRHCMHCGCYFPSWSSLRVHMEHVHQVYVCPLCEFTTSDRKHFQVHRKKTHFSKRRIVCSTCHKVFRKDTSLEAHQRDKRHGDWAVTWECDVCFQHFATLSALTHHENTFCRSLSDGKKPLCHYCGESFEEEAHLIDHNPYCFAREKAVTAVESDGSPPRPGKDYRGGIGERKPPKSFPKPRKLHLRKRRKNERNRQQIYEQQSNSAPSLLQPAPAPLQAPSHSPGAQSESENLASALPFICETCGFLFGEQRFLQNHQMKASHGQYQQKCRDCGKCCRSCDALDNHQRSKGHGQYAHP